jgi:hypothetical protein
MTAADFASALDNVWPHFAAEGCKRTSKDTLIRKNIIYKVSMVTIEPSPLNSVLHQVARAPEPAQDEAQPYFNRPGSAYVMNLGVGGNKSCTLRLLCPDCLSKPNTLSLVT